MILTFFGGLVVGLVIGGIGGLWFDSIREKQPSPWHK